MDTTNKITINLYEGSELYAELEINKEEQQGYLKYFYKGKEIVESFLYESFNPKLFALVVFLAHTLCLENNVVLWSY